MSVEVYKWAKRVDRVLLWARRYIQCVEQGESGQPNCDSDQFFKHDEKMFSVKTLSREPVSRACASMCTIFGNLT